MFQQRFNKKYNYNSFLNTPRSSQQHNLKNDKPILSEWKFGIIGLIMSIVVITGKLYFLYQDDIKHLILERKLLVSEVINQDGNVVFLHTWKTVVKYSNIWLPILCGALTTYFTWLMVYLDSHVPGVQPPSPFSPTKYKTVSGHSFHLNYVFAVIIGILVTAYMYWRNVNLEYL